MDPMPDDGRAGKWWRVRLVRAGLGHAGDRAQAGDEEDLGGGGVRDRGCGVGTGELYN
jgi:hypothetical protein